MIKNILNLVIPITIFIGLTGCTSAIMNKNLQKKWYIVELKGYSKAQLMNEKASLDLSTFTENSKIRGSVYAGCNQIMFNLEVLKRNRIKLSGLTGTMMTCQDMQIEHVLSKQLELMTNYKIEGHFLTLSDNKGNSIKLLAEDWD